MPPEPHNSQPLDSLGVCSWSLQPRDADELADRLVACSSTRVQLALEPLRSGGWSLDSTVTILTRAGIRIASAMMSTHAEDYSTLESIHATGGLRPDEHWPINRDIAVRDASLAAQLGVPLVTFHAGFLPDNPDSPLGQSMLSRLRAVADIFASHDIRIALETGQDSSATLLRYLTRLNDLRVGVNFDPANMLLYASGDPITALRDLLPHVAQVHIKDARRTRVPGTWGDEVRVGDGEVQWPAFFAELAAAGRSVPAMIEREAGEDRLDDIRHAVSVTRRYVHVS